MLFDADVYIRAIDSVRNMVGVRYDPMVNLTYSTWSLGGDFVSFRFVLFFLYIFF